MNIFVWTLAITGWSGGWLTARFCTLPRRAAGTESGELPESASLLADEHGATLPTALGRAAGTESGELPESASLLADEHGATLPTALGRAAEGGAGRSVSIIIPARNEAQRLGNLLTRLDRSAVHDLVVVDDGSTDGTADVARGLGARVVEADPPPPGWTGKTHACWTGAQATSGAVLLFLDADTEPGPHLVARVADQVHATQGLVSVQPWHRVERPYEQLSAAPNLVAVLATGTGRLCEPRWWRRPAAFGPVLAMPRSRYTECGGHQAVRGAVAEDIALARLADARGIPIATWIGGEAVAFRMYGEGLGQLVEGWSKNLATGAGSVPPLRLSLVVAWVAAAAQASVLLAAALAGTGALGWPAIVMYAAFAMQAGLLGRRLGRFGVAWVVAMPLLVGAFIAIFLRSLVLTVRGRTVPWRGRPVPVRSRSRSRSWS